MEASGKTLRPEAPSLEDRIRGVSPLSQIESHEWSVAEWATSERLLDSVEADLALARGRLIYERFLRSGASGDRAHGVNGHPALPLFNRAAEIYRQTGDRRGEREALFWVGTLEQVLNHDYAAASRALEQSRELAEVAGDGLVLSCVERHLGFIAFLEGMLTEAQTHLEESVRLRRAMNFQPGVAMGLVALADLSIDRHEVERAQRLLDEAASIAQASGASGAMRAIDEARLGVKTTK
jgi:nucleotide-binding universal stress UspA family protein